MKASRTGDSGAARARVLMLVENLSVPFDRRVWKECRALTAARYDVTAISPRGGDCDRRWHEILEGVSIYRYPSFESSGGVLSYAVEYAVAVMSMSILAWTIFVLKGFDVIHLANPPDILIFVAAPFRLFGVKVIFDQHDLSPEIYEHQHPRDTSGIVYRLLLWLEYVTYRLSNAVICITRSVCEVATRRGQVAADRLFLVRNGPDLQSFQRATADAALRNGKAYLLVYVGMMGPQDGVDILLRSVKILRDQLGRRDFHLHLVGGGTELNRLRGEADRLGIAEHLHFAGKCGYDDVVRAIASADVCLCPDPKTPMNDRANLVKVSEYMCLGKPVVAFDLNEVRFSASDAALYAEPNDERDFAEKINVLLDRPSQREQMGTVGRQRVRDLLSWDHSKEALYAAYDRALSHDAARTECVQDSISR